MNGKFTIGVVGFCPPTIFDEGQATVFLILAFDQASRDVQDNTTIVVRSGLTNVGVPALAYTDAVRRGWKTAGVICRRRAEKYADNAFPVDEKIIVEDEAAESEVFLETCNVLVRAGGGQQSLDETKLFRARGGWVIESDIPVLGG